jgi:hypothetical protein
MDSDGFVKSRHPGESRGPGHYNQLKTLDSGFRRNDESGLPATFYEFINSLLFEISLIVMGNFLNSRI